MTDIREDCLFCRITSGELGTAFVVESDHVVAFDDISPQAPTHVLVTPKKHVESIHELSPDDADLWTEMLSVVRQVAEARGVHESGYRIVSNAGPDSGQEVAHLHIHLLGGGRLGPIT